MEEKKYKYIEHTADIAIEVTGNSFEDLIKNAYSAYLSIAIEGEITDNDERKMIFEGKEMEDLLLSFLNEMNFLFMAGKWVGKYVKKISYEELGSTHLLEVIMCGEKYNALKHSLKEEIKAVTHHQLKINVNKNQYKTLIIFDI